MQRDRVPVVAVRPRQRAVFDEYAREKCGLFQRIGHRPGLVANERKVANALGPIGELDFKLVAAKPANADNIDHHVSSPSMRSTCPSVRQAIQFLISSA